MGYLRPEIAILRTRVVQGGHPAFITDGLTRQVDLYDQWAAQQSASLLRIDNSATKIGTVKKLLESFHQC